MLQRILDLLRPKRSRQAAPATPGKVTLGYAPKRDGRADPGEVVWTWVPYEEDPKQGKDRPVLVIGTVGSKLAVVPLSSKEHDGDRGWVPVGTGGWDRDHRPSWARVDRVLQVDAKAVRREGSALDRARFDTVVDAARAYLPR